MANVALYIFLLSLPLESAIQFEGGATWSRLIGLFLFAIWILNRGLARKSIRNIFEVYYLIPALLIISLAFASNLWAEYDVRLSKIITLIQLLFMSLIVIDLSTSLKKARTAVGFLVLGALITVGVMFYQYFIKHSYRAGAELAGGINETATFLAILIPFSFYLFQESESKFWRIIGFLYLIACPFAVIISFSRAAFVLLILALVLLLRGMFQSKIRGFLYFVALVLIFVAFLFDFLPFEFILKRVEIFSQFVSGATLATMQVESSRIYIYHVATAIWSDHILLGVGYDNFGYHFLEYQNNFITSSVPRYWTKTGLSPHSSVFGILAELGILGLLLFGWLIWKGLSTIRNTYTMAKGLPSAQKMFIQILFYCFLLCSINGLVNVMLADKIFWFLLGLIEVARRLIRDGLPEDVPQAIPNDTGYKRSLKGRIR